MSDHNHHNPDDAGWADRPAVRRFILFALFAACALAAAAGFYSEWRNPHPHFEAEEFPVFFAVYGFVAFMFIVLAGQHLRALVGRKETYYDERE
ncbi:MAG: hypothetical protein ACE5FO_09150 [Parvularculaceae bacterium]